VLLALIFLTNVIPDDGFAQEFRTVDNRPKLDRTRLESCGLSVYESKRLILVTDVPTELVRDLPELADQLFDALVRELGAPRPEINGAEFQVTGFLIDAKERFEHAGVLPPEDYPFRHGRHFDYQFWMNNQMSNYYRRHLMLHEFVHCFMTADHGMFNIPPLWYTEGIAEYFATHRLENDGTPVFGVMPDSLDGYEGWGRITTIKEAVERTSQDDSFRTLSLETVRHPPDNVFVSDLKYAQAWALVWLIRNHPDLKIAFSNFSSVRNRDQFRAAEQGVSKDMWRQLAILWQLYLFSLTEGYDPEHSSVSPPEGKTVSAELPLTLNLSAKTEWLNTGLSFPHGEHLELTCSGRYSLHDQPRPWLSEPPGITIDYWRGLPLGRIVALAISSDGRECRRISVGSSASFTMPFEGTVWIQINDSAASRVENSGSASVTIRGVTPSR
ncbi:MAG: hypothetical protein ACK58L_08830, partial [Planctomycetota bacterium]